MPFALVTIGLIMIVTGARNTYKAFGDQVTADFTGEGNFTFWVASIGAIGAVGYVKSLQSLSRVFLALVIAVMVLKNGGFFDNFTKALKSGPTNPQASATVTPEATQTSGGFGNLLKLGTELLPLAAGV